VKKIVPYVILLSVIILFFYKTIFFGKIPFAGELLLSTYAPWRHVSYFGYVAGSVPNKDQYFDVVRELYPWKTEVIRQMKDKTMPLWNPYSFSGSPLLANYQSQVFYPLGLLYFVLPQVVAFTILIILQPLLGGIFTYLFASSIGMSVGGALIAAIAFNFSSFASVWMEFGTVVHTILWLPLMLYIFEKGIRIKKITIGNQMLFIFALFSSMTAGHPQDFINAFLFLCLYMVIRIYTLNGWERKDKILFILHPLSYIVVLPFLLAAPQLLPTVELFKNSARVPHDYQFIMNTMLYQPWHITMFLVQDFFGNPTTKSFILSTTYIGKAASIGIVAFFLSLYSVRLWRKSWHVTFFLVASIVLVLYTVNTPLASILYRYPIPILSTGTPTRILFLLCLSLSVLAGFGFDELNTSKKILWKPIFAIGLILFCMWIFIFIQPNLPDISYSVTSRASIRKPILMATGLIGISILIAIISLRKKIFLYVMIGLVCIELFYGFNKFNPFVPKGFVFPENPLISYFQNLHGIDRIWGYGTARIEANFSTQYRLFSTDGTDPLNLFWYNEFIQASRDGNIAKKFDRTTRSDAQIAPGYGARELPDNPYRLRIMDALGVKYIIDRLENPKDDTTFPNDRYKEIWRQNDWTVYENLFSAPRYFLTASYYTYNTVEEFEQKYFSSDFDPKTTVLLTHQDASDLPTLTHNLTSVIKLKTYETNRIQFETTTDTSELLYISDTYDSGWHGYLDGIQTPVLKANYAFRAILVPPGSHTVIFSYEPQSFFLGVKVMYIGFSAMSVILLWHLCKKYVPKSKNKK